ncbi:class I SAM-dependent methyltransferase [Cupriavidus pinatubonensis]|uniref:class I SAM-dependent methyltransferase n=1 Tax=Cupriavidus pinatubonensis TaxID=248026 RepID=UPI00360E032A
MTTAVTPTRSVLAQRFKQRLKPLIPAWVLKFHRDRVIRREGSMYEGKPLGEVFTHVYKTGAWGVAEDQSGFYSGSSSHDSKIVEPYVKAVTEYLSALPERPAVVDLGCGDFNVGKRIRSVCGHYMACDVVDAAIQSNRTRFSHLDVDFRCVDITTDPLPPGDIVFLRQVLDHLDNARIATVLSKLGPYKILILTEYLPLGSSFTPNLDKAIGSHLRLFGAQPSGLVLTAPPFNMKVLSARILCEVPDSGGVIRTIAYELPGR